MSIICFGEILWDILPNEKLPGGAPMNVCYHLNRLGQTAAIISKIGADENGTNLLAFLNKKQVDTSLIQIDTQLRTGTVMATQNGNEMNYDILRPVAWDFIDFSEELAESVAAAPYFVYGSLSARNESSANTLSKLLHRANTKVLDVNLRPPHYNRYTIGTLLESTDILKLNNHELALVAGWHTNEKDFEKQVASLSTKFAIPTIIVTKGSDGASVLHNGNYYHHAGYTVKVADTIGSGDAFLAGFLSKYIEAAPIDVALDFACQLGAYVASKKGGCPQYEIDDIGKP